MKLKNLGAPFSEMLIFEGRLKREDYIIRMILITLYSGIGVMITMQIQDLIYKNFDRVPMGNFFIVFSFCLWLGITFLLGASISIRRLRAINYSLWWSLLIFLPVGWFLLFLLLSLKKDDF